MIVVEGKNGIKVWWQNCRTSLPTPSEAVAAHARQGIVERVVAEIVTFCTPLLTLEEVKASRSTM